MILHAIYISLLPLAFELGTEIYRTKVLNRRDKHFLTASIRVLITLWGSLTYFEVEWFKTAVLSFSVHWLVFNYAFNKYALGIHWAYLGGNFLDKLQKEINPYVLLIMKVLCVISSILWIL